MIHNPRRVLVFSPTPTYPTDYGNRKRIYSVCQWFKQHGAEIHFAYYPFESDWRLDPSFKEQEMMSSQWDFFDIVPATRQQIQSSAEGYFHQIDEWWDESIGHYIKWKTSQIRFDAVIVNYPFYSKVFDYVPYYCLKILDAHDKFSGRRELLEKMGVAPEFFYTDEINEKIALDRADLVWAIKEEEAQFYQKLTTKPIIKSLIHAETAGKQIVASEVLDRVKNEGFLKVGFIGAGNSINISNITRFIEVAEPIFKENLTPVKLIIAGSISGAVYDLNSEWVEVIGLVDHVDDFYTEIDLIVVPMDLSTGLKIKVGEALSYGAPLVSHEHAFEGYPSRHKAHELTSFEEMAEFCVRCAYEPELLIELAEASVNSYAACAEKFDSSLLSSYQILSNFKPRATLIIEQVDFEKSKVSYYQLLSLISILQNNASIVLYIVDRNLEKNVERDLNGRCLVEAISKDELANSRQQIINNTDFLVELTQGQLYLDGNQVTDSFNFVNNISWRFPFNFKQLQLGGALLVSSTNVSISREIAVILSKLYYFDIYLLNGMTLSKFNVDTAQWDSVSLNCSLELNLIESEIGGVLELGDIGPNSVLEIIKRSNIPAFKIEQLDCLTSGEIHYTLSLLLGSSTEVENPEFYSESQWQWLWDLINKIEAKNKLNLMLYSFGER